MVILSEASLYGSGLGGGWLSLLTMKISSSCRAKIGADGQVVATNWKIFEMVKSDFCRAEVPSPPQDGA